MFPARVLRALPYLAITIAEEDHSNGTKACASASINWFVVIYGLVLLNRTNQPCLRSSVEIRFRLGIYIAQSI